MTPKEKAEDLLSKYYFQVQTLAKQKQCALISVDEILNGYEFDSLDIKHKRIMDNINYWDKVKQEIENL
jgi:uncharacterized protein YfaA (DUF2138 family)